MTDPNRTSDPECVWCGQTMAGHRDSGPMAKMPCGGLKRGFIAEIGSKLFSETSVGDVPAPFVIEPVLPCSKCGEPHVDECDPEDSAKFERAAVVKYLRGHLANYERSQVVGAERTEGRALLKLLIEAIEKGEHL